MRLALLTKCVPISFHHPIIVLHADLCYFSVSQRQALDELQSKFSALQLAYDADVEKRKDVEKEQEDLLVLLDELNGKRSRDKQRMREVGMEVSEDEADDEDEDEDEDE